MRLQLLAASVVVLAACKPHPPVPIPPKPTAEPTAHALTHTMAPLPATVADWAKGARIFENLGTFHRKVTTDSDEAQRYFDQGMRYLWSFNHDESTRSFAKAAQIDTECGICYWGVALTVGPNYNLPFMAEPRAKVAAEALGLAQAHSARSSPVEKALIEALAKRYPSAQPLDPATAAPVLAAYSQGMRQVAGKFKNDMDVQTLFAESLMNLNAWKLWSLDGKPAPGTKEIQATLEGVLARDPGHPGANHYYMHTMEASPTPGKSAAVRGTGRRYDAGSRTSGAHALAHHAAGRALSRGARSQPQSSAGRRDVFQGDAAARLLRDVLGAQLPVSRLFGGHGRTEG